MRTVALFRWDSPIPGESEEQDAEALTTLSSRPAVDAIVKGLQGLGHSANILCDEHGGWWVDVTVANVPYSLYVNWTAMGSRSENYIAVLPDIRRGCLASLFFNRPAETKLLPVCGALHTVLQAIPDLSELRWISNDEFNRAYGVTHEIPVGSNIPG
jgi:hypothetical protein